MINRPPERINAQLEGARRQAREQQYLSENREQILKELGTRDPNATLSINGTSDLERRLRESGLDATPGTPTQIRLRVEEKTRALPLSSTRSRETVDKLERAAREADQARADGTEVVTDGSPFFSFTPIVAFRGGLHGTSIPAVAANVQPFDFGDGNAAQWFNPLGIQAIFGGVLNPESDDSGPNAAVGAGLWYPIGATGSIAVGYALWEDGSETRSGVYIGLSLGQSTKKVEPPGER